MAAPLLVTKLHIPLVRPDLVSRPRLIERLNEGLRLGHRLTLISAPAGYGKTTLLAEWIANRRIADGRIADLEIATSPHLQSPISPSAIAWLSLDDGDNDLARFMAYLVAALQTADERVGQGVLDVLQSLQPPPVETLIAPLINQMEALSGGLVLVLDDYHLITAQPVHDALAFLLDHLPPRVYLVVASRADPPLHLARLRARGQLTELRQADLCFTPAEAADLVNQVMGLGLAAADVAALSSLTEGWIAGLQLAALALARPGALQGPPSMPGQNDVSGLIRALTGSNRYILDYLIEEVFERQPDGIQAFLLQTSILERLTGSLCDAVVGQAARWPHDGQATLEYLDQANLFIVPLDDERRWYRYHQLFDDLLRKRLLQTSSDLVPTLHRRASLWYEQHGLVAEAIEHALSAEDWGRAADLIEGAAEPALMRGEVVTLSRWLDALPDEAVRAHPMLCVFHTWMLLFSGRPLAVVESRLRDADRYSDLIGGQITALRALVAAFCVRLPDAIELADRALAQLPSEDIVFRGFALWILSTYDLMSGSRSMNDRTLEEIAQRGLDAGNVMIAVAALGQLAEFQERRGHLHKAWELYQRALDLATDARGRRMPLAGQSLVGLAGLSREWNDLDAALDYLREGIALIEPWHETGAMEAYLSLAWIRQTQGDLDGAQGAVHRARQLAIQFDATEFDDFVVAIAQARVWIAQGNLEAAGRWAAEREVYAYLDSPLPEASDALPECRLRKYELIMLARLFLAQGQPELALKALASALPVAERQERPRLIVEAHLLQALAFQSLGRPDRAMAALERALALAEPEGYMRVFLDEGPPLAGLLRRTAARGVAQEYVGRLLAAFESAGSGLPAAPAQASLLRAQPLDEPLSERELEVLRLLATDLSSTEMARTLFVAPSTVRTHIKGIYGKLDVHSRQEAIERAQEWGLL